MKKLFTLIACLATAALGHAQIGTLCNDAAPACAQTGLTFTNTTGVTPGLGTINCLGSSPNPTFYYMQVDDAGTINMSLAQTNNSGTNTDVDFQLWGPFSSVSAGCTSISNNVASSNADCSYAGGGTIEQVNIVNGQPGDFYILLITNFSNQPGTITLTLNSNSTGTTNCGILSNAQNNGPICEDEILLLTGDDGGTGGGPYTYNWYLMPDFTTSLNNSTNFAFSPPAPGTYQFAFVLMDQATFEADTAYTTAVVNEIPDAPTFSSTAPACEGSTVMMAPDAPISGAIYNWSGTNGFTSNQPTVTFANANPALFNATYTLTVTVNGCTSPPYSEPLVVFDTEVPVVSGPTEVCEGQTVPLYVSNGGDFVSFEWNGMAGSNPQEVPAGSHIVTGTDANGCETSSAPYVVDLIDNPLEITGPDHFCEGDPITLSATAGKQSYSWSTGSSAETTEVNADGLVIVSVVSQDGCERSDSLLVRMYDTPNVSFSPLLSCDSLVAFQNNTQVSDAYGSVQQTYSWNFGHINPDTTQAVSSLSDPTHGFPAPGTYNVTFTVETSNGCSDDIQVAFQVYQKPIVNFEFESLCFAEGKFLNLSQEGSNGFETVSWDFGDGSATFESMDSVLFYGYPTIATYTVTLTVTDSASCESSLTKEITLKETPVFEEIPNIITPNGDNVNDDYTFLPVYEDCFNYSFVVFNRWGAKVFETENSSKGFGGITGLGSKLQDGVYFWVLTANGYGAGEGEQVLKKGSITVIASGTK